jgi:hypothetical protein
MLLSHQLCVIKMAIVIVTLDLPYQPSPDEHHVQLLTIIFVTVYVALL